MFELEKYYLDCVTPEGGVFLGYWGRARYRGVALEYASALADSGARYSLRRGQAPREQDGALRWEAPALEVSGEWRAREQPVASTVYESAAGRIDWECRQPAADARVRLAGGREIAGLGYAERLRMTIPPWRLPLRTLRWGRFLTEGECWVWIDWQGPHVARFAFRNGGAIALDAVEDGGLRAAEAHLRFDRGRVLRSGELGATALAALRGVRRALPRGVFAIQEHKWLSRAVLTEPGRAPREGWAIHEVVQWP